QEVPIAGVIEISEAVAEAEGTVERAGPGQVAHVALFERRRKSFHSGAAASILEQTGAQVHAGQSVTAPGQLQGKSTGAARNVGNAGALRRLQRLLQKVGFGPRLLRGHPTPQRFLEEIAGEKGLPPGSG